MFVGTHEGVDGFSVDKTNDVIDLGEIIRHA